MTINYKKLQISFNFLLNVNLHFVLIVTYFGWQLRVNLMNKEFEANVFIMFNYS